MHDRSALGPADVDDARLAVLVAAALGVDDVELLSSRAEVVAYDIEALTTAGRYRVTGRARLAGGVAAFAFFVKVVQSWGRSPAFRFVPEEMREFALAAYPFEAEPRVYRNDLADRLPSGLTMPRAYAVIDLDAESTALWLEDVPVVSAHWDRAALAHAAQLLGRLAASPRVRPLATVADPGQHRTLRSYAEGRVAAQVVPALHDDAIWRHPVVTPAFDDTLRHDLVAAADTLPAVVAELEALPYGSAHGDACTRNLLVAADRPELVLIDFGFWGPQPYGFDLGQLLLGEVQLGERPAAALPDDERACLAAYVDGLRAEGCDVDGSVVERGLALVMLL
ncbi:MAG TPA: phosphotransferase, partial [Pseudonocardia sp.]|nr:phosphotransferase [Pseudonocardia sp.]